jgi:hypothetical protein
VLLHTDGVAHCKDLRVPQRTTLADAWWQVVLVWNSDGGARNESQPRLLQLATQLWRDHGPVADDEPGLLHSVWANFQVPDSNRLIVHVPCACRQRVKLRAVHL